MMTSQTPLISKLPDGESPLKVSVALATYNGQSHLAEQLESLARQRLLPAELVVTDDGSTDKTLDIIRSFAQTAPFPVRVYSNSDRLGYGGNFLRAATLCSGDLIAFCDQDDYWLEEKLATCVQYFADSEVALLIHSAETWNGQARLGRLYPFHERTEITAPGITNVLELTPGFAVIFRRSLLTLTDNQNRPGCLFGLSNGSIMAHDAWIRLLGAATGKTARLQQVLALYRQHGSNTVGAPGKVGWRRKLQLAMTNADYLMLADFEAKCYEVLAGIPDELAPAYAKERHHLADQFLQKSKLHHLRHTLYNRSASLVGRLSSFAKLLASGAYWGRRKDVAIGPRAALKDLSFGVSGLYKHFTRP